MVFILLKDSYPSSPLAVQGGLSLNNMALISSVGMWRREGGKAYGFPRITQVMGAHGFLLLWNGTWNLVSTELWGIKNPVHPSSSSFSAHAFETQSTHTLSSSLLNPHLLSFFSLTVVDSDGASSSTTASLTVNKAVDYPPVAIAGPNQVITLPQNSITLYGNQSTDDHGIVSYEWSLSPNSKGKVVEMQVRASVGHPSCSQSEWSQVISLSICLDI